jgi:carbon monoxide dehydrogenase subunit G
MNLQGERIIPAPVQKTWEALNDPQTLKACIAGCESIEVTGENQYLAVMAVRIGPVNAKFKGRLQLTDIVAPQSYKINFDGQGGVAGFGKGSADVSLMPEGTDGEATKLSYTAAAQVGGKIAQIGSRLVESAAAKIADDFFKAFEAKMTAPTDAAAEAASAPAVATDGTPLPPSTFDHVVGKVAQPQPAGGGSSTVWWIAGIIILALLIFFFTR